MIKRLNPKHLERLLNKKCDVVIYQEGLSEDGEPLTSLNLENQKCRFVETTKIIISSDGRKIQLVGKVILLGDIAPTIKKISGGQVIINNIEYETTIAKSNIYDIYGALVKNECVCEGYAKSFKYLLDQMNIPCIIVIGKATNTKGQTENHAWNYVQINEKWYAVDCTWDDPVIVGNGKIGNNTKYKYFLRGNEYMAKDHILSGQFTEGGQVYTYPELSATDY